METQQYCLPEESTIVRTAVNPHGGWKRVVEQKIVTCVHVRTAVNPHGGWKPIALVDRQGEMRVRTAVNPHGGWKPDVPVCCFCWSDSQNGR